MSDNNDVEEDW
jgi:hypothetical protein